MLPSVRTTQAVAAAVYFPAIFVSGALFPREVLPTFAQRLGDVLPMTYAVRIIREAWTMGTIDGVALGVCAGHCDRRHRDRDQVTSAGKRAEP